jgi:hypothetical protein
VFETDNAVDDANLFEYSAIDGVEIRPLYNSHEIAATGRRGAEEYVIKLLQRGSHVI